MSRTPYGGASRGGLAAIVLAIGVALAVWLMPRATEGQQGNFPAGGVPNFPILAPSGSAVAPSYAFSAQPGSGIFNLGTGLGFTAQTALVYSISSGGINVQNGITLQAPLFSTNTNCSSSASPAVCSASAAGSVTLAAAATTEVVNTTAVTANSQIILQRDDSLGTKLAVTCNTATVVGTIRVSARTGGTSFTIAVDTTPATNPLCLSYSIVN